MPEPTPMTPRPSYGELLIGSPGPPIAPGTPPTAMRASDPLPDVLPTEPGCASAGALLIAVATRRIATAAAGTERPAPTRDISERWASRTGATAGVTAGADRAARPVRAAGRAGLEAVTTAAGLTG